MKWALAGVGVLPPIAAFPPSALDADEEWGGFQKHEKAPGPR